MKVSTKKLYNLFDDQAEYQLRDRLSFMRFLGLELEDTVPDAKTLWLYREALGRRRRPPTRPARRCAPVSSMYLVIKRTAWEPSSCAPSASSAREAKSE